MRSIILVQHSTYLVFIFSITLGRVEGKGRDYLVKEKDKEEERTWNFSSI